MKTIKFIIAALLLSVTVYSCSSDREEDTVQQSSTPKLDLRKLKTSNNQSAAKTVDTLDDKSDVIVSTVSAPAANTVPVSGNNENETVNPGQLGTPPTRP